MDEDLTRAIRHLAEAINKQISRNVREKLPSASVSGKRKHSADDRASAGYERLGDTTTTREINKP